MNSAKSPQLFFSWKKSCIKGKRRCAAGLGAPPPPPPRGGEGGPGGGPGRGGVWVPPPPASQGVVGLTGLGARHGRCMVLCWGLVPVLPGSAHGPGHGECREGGRSWMPDKAPAELQFLLPIHQGTVPLFYLVQPHRMECFHILYSILLW